ncbi:hypothetical protein M0R19_05420 [Candidatus Pacearchaeota archaeon]|jgi:hypothetical protein|nr:hypothetical protein [Candidatus Pacearchaeota archaeon]
MDTLNKIIYEKIYRMEWEHNFQKEVKKQNYFSERNNMSKEERITKLEAEVCHLKTILQNKELEPTYYKFSKKEDLDSLKFTVDSAIAALIGILDDNQLIAFVKWCQEGKLYPQIEWLELAEKEKAKRWCKEHSK